MASIPFTRIKGLVSVVVSNYNYESYVYECLEGIRNQTYKNWEIIYVDDGSTDNSVQQVNTWLKDKQILFPNNNKVIIIPLPRNTAIAGAMNTGCYQAQGEYIIHHDVDDISHVERLEKQVHYLNHHPDIELLGTNLYFFNNDDVNHIVGKSNWAYSPEEIRDRYNYNGGRFLTGQCVCMTTAMMRGTLFDRIGGFRRDPLVKGAPGFDLVARCQHPQRANIANLLEPLYYCRMHSRQNSVIYTPYWNENILQNPLPPSFKSMMNDFIFYPQ